MQERQESTQVQEKLELGLVDRWLLRFGLGDKQLLQPFEHRTEAVWMG